MDYKAKRLQAYRMIAKYGTMIKVEQVITGEGVNAWTPVQPETVMRDAVCVSFADDGVTFVNHNITGDVSLFTIGTTEPDLFLHVGDVIVYEDGRRFTVRLAKPLDPTKNGAILWAALAQ